jgi:hypothetical protein
MEGVLCLAWVCSLPRIDSTEPHWGDSIGVPDQYDKKLFLRPVQKEEIKKHTQATALLLQRMAGTKIKWWSILLPSG